MDETDIKPLRWIGSSKKDFDEFPKEVQHSVGLALMLAQFGGKAPYAKPLKGFGDAGVLEVVESFDGDAFRTVYTVRFAEIVYVLHAFQKKSKKGIATPKRDLDLIERRLTQAREEHEEWLESGKPSGSP